MTTITVALNRWHQLVATRDFRQLASLLNSDVALRSPLGFQPFKGAQAVAQILRIVSEVLTNFRYEREFISKDHRSVALEFSASIGDKQIKGVDILRFAEDGTLVELEIMARPLNAVQALRVAMAKRLGVSTLRTLVAAWFARRAPR